MKFRDQRGQAEVAGPVLALFIFFVVAPIAVFVFGIQKHSPRITALGVGGMMPLVIFTFWLMRGALHDRKVRSGQLRVQRRQELRVPGSGWQNVTVPLGSLIRHWLRGLRDRPHLGIWRGFVVFDYGLIRFEAGVGRVCDWHTYVKKSGVLVLTRNPPPFANLPPVHLWRFGIQIRISRASAKLWFRKRSRQFKYRRP